MEMMADQLVQKFFNFFLVCWYFCIFMSLIMTVFDTGYVGGYKKVVNELGHQKLIPNTVKCVGQETQNQINLVTLLEHCLNLENYVNARKKLFTKFFALFLLFQSNIRPEQGSWYAVNFVDRFLANSVLR